MRRRKGRTTSLPNIPGMKQALKNVVKGLEIEQTRGVLFYNDITNKQIMDSENTSKQWLNNR